MEVNLLGYRVVDFTDRQSGQHVKGTNLYVCGKTDGVVGMEAWKQFIAETGLNLEVGAKYDFQYSRSGSLSDFKKI